MNIRWHFRIVMLAGLVLVLAACTETPVPQAGLTPTVNAFTPIPTTIVQPSPTPTPLGGASAQLGPIPQSCPPSSILAPKTISPKFVPMFGAGPVWAGGIVSYEQIPLALVWTTEDALVTHDQYGWEHKLLWVAATSLHGSVTIRGTNLRTGAPIYPDAEYASAASTLPSLVLEPEDPAVVSQDANRDAQWTQFPGSLTIPGAGCYSLEAVWPGGSWHMIFAAGSVPG